MRKKVNKVLAAVMAAALMMTAAPITASATSTTEWNSNGGQQTQTGNVSYESATLEVTLPGDLAFELNSDFVGDVPAQILGEDYNIINNSTVPVRVVIAPYLDLGTSPTIMIPSGSVNGGERGWPLNSGTKYKTDLKEGTKKAVKLVAILADFVGSGTESLNTDGSNNRDKNDDGVYEFDYTGVKLASGTILGRDKYTYYELDATDGSYSAGDRKPITELRSGTTTKIGSGTNSTGIIDVGSTKPTLGSGAAIGNNNDRFVVYLDSSLEAQDKLAEGKFQLGNITSFTVVGLVDPKQTYTEGDIPFKVVYQMDIVTPNEKAYNVKFTSGNTNYARDFGQGAIEWIGTNRGYTSGTN